MTDNVWRPNDAQVLTAARILDSELRFHGHLTEYATYEEMLDSDPIGASEYGGMIERMLMASYQSGYDAGYEYVMNSLSSSRM